MSLNLIFGYGNQYYFTPVITCPNGLENITARFKYTQSTGSGSMAENVAIGQGALMYNSGPDGNEWYGNSSVPNIAIGNNALNKNLQGNYNIAIGLNASYWNSTGINNIVIGHGALYNSTTGSDNVVIGNHNLFMCSQTDPGQPSIPISCGDYGSKTIAIGNAALEYNSGAHCVGIGYQALYSNISGNSNIGIGTTTLFNNVTGGNNIAIGPNALYSNISGTHNIALSNAALYNNIGLYNIAIGTRSAYHNYNGSNNIGIGLHALYSNVSGHGSTCVGAYALKHATGASNTAVGRGAGFNHSGIDSIFIGKFDINTTVYVSSPELNEEADFLTSYGTVTPSNSGNRVISIGNDTLTQNTSDNLIAIGHNALQLNMGGTLNTAVGAYALQNNILGANNVALGYATLRYSVGGNANTAIGCQVLPNIDYSGANNTGVGYRALYGVTTGFDNTAIGKLAGSGITSGFNNTLIGSNAAASSPTATNEMTLGNGITVLRCGTTTITGISDVRDKTNIEEIPVGLDYINALHPVKFDWNARDGTKIGEKDFGFIAQELDLIEQQFGYQEYTRLVNKNNPDRLETDYMKTYPILVKAIQELSNKIDFILNHLNLNI